MRYPTPAEWLKLLEEFQMSSLEQKEFAAKHDISLGTFRIRSTTTVSTHEQPGATQGRWRRERRGQFEFVSGSAAG